MKAVIPAIGLAPRFLPLAKAVPKEMLPLGNKPAIHYVVSEAVSAGFDEILLLLDTGKESIRSYFTPDAGLEAYLESVESLTELEAVRQATSIANIQFKTWEGRGGIGDALPLTRDFVADDPFFAVLVGDAVMQHGSPLSHMVEAWNSLSRSSVCIDACLPHLISQHTIAGGRELEVGIFEISKIAEKPEPADAPQLVSQKGTRLPFHAVASRYLFSPAIFDCMEEAEKNETEGDKLSSALDLLRERSGLLGITWFGERLNIGTPEEFLESAKNFVSFGC